MGGQISPKISEMTSKIIVGYMLYYYLPMFSKALAT